MKKILFALVLVLSLSISVFAQRNDAFFKTDNDDYYNRISDPTNILAMPAGDLGSTTNEPAPLGNGLIILTAVGLGYAIKKRNK